MKQKIILISLALLILIIISLVAVVYADSYVLLCLEKGQKIEYSKCNPAMTDSVCDSSLCISCTKLKDSGVYCPASPNKCNALGLSCSSLGNTTLDTQPPKLNINFPLQDYVYNTRNVKFNLTLDEESDVYYLENSTGKGRWQRLCSDCSAYYGTRNFKDGLNNLTIKAEDVLDNTAFYNLSFWVDSKKPRITSIEPRKGFSSGLFEIEFSEENARKLMLYYSRNLSAYQEARELNLNECTLNKDKYSCSINVDLQEYENQEIEYYFNLTDIAGNSDSKKQSKIKIDTTFPVIEQLDYKKDKRSMIFNMSIIESNFLALDYIDWNDANPRWKTLCSRLKDGNCEARKSFKEGNHVLDIQVTDKAGNSIARRIDFAMNYTTA